MNLSISGTTKLVAIIGDPILYSASPKLHNFAYQIDHLDYVYTAFRVPKGQAKQALDAMRALGIRGYNVTMPLKQEVLADLDQLSAEAELLGAVNTVVNENGFLTGYNTDGYGMMKNISEAGVAIAGSTLLILGGGGAATAILGQAALDGVKKIHLANRGAIPKESLAELIERIQIACPSCQIDYGDLADHSFLERAISDSQIIINATPLGMRPDTDTTPLPHPEWLHTGHTVVDAVYKPRQTLFLREAAQMGAKTIDGFGMLLWQASRGYELFVRQKMPMEAVYTRFSKEE